MRNAATRSISRGGLVEVEGALRVVNLNETELLVLLEATGNIRLEVFHFLQEKHVRNTIETAAIKDTHLSCFL